MGHIKMWWKALSDAMNRSQETYLQTFGRACGLSGAASFLCGPSRLRHHIREKDIIVFKQIWGSGASLLATVALLAGCGTTSSVTAPVSHPASGPIHLVDDVGDHLTLSKPATRIITLEPSNAEIALTLGLKKEIVGTDASTFQYTPAPWKSELKGLKNIGPSYPGINLEDIVAAKPDLVIAATGIKGLSSLSQYHIPVLILNPASINGVYHDMMLVGEATGKTAKATAVVNTMKSDINAIEADVKATTARPTVFYDLGGLYTAGPDSFVNSLIDMAGAVNVGANLSTQQYPEVTDEQVVKADPEDIIIDPTSGTTISQEEHLAGFSVISAVQTGRVWYVPNSSYVNEPSPALVMGLKELVKLFHPNVKVGS